MKMELKIEFMCIELVHVHRNLDGIEVFENEMLGSFSRNKI